MLRFISETNPIIQAQEVVVQHYRVPDTFQRILENTKLVGRLGGVVTPIIAADDVVAAGSSKTAGVTAFGGIQVSIPLSSLDEERTLANKHVELTKAIDQIKGQTLQDMAQLRTYEADLAAAEVRMQFYRDQLRWLQKRLEEGYSEMEKLWTVGGKLNDEKAAVERITLLAETQRHRLAQYAGEEWETLLAYLEGKRRLPGF
ncbi:hypothetical protein ACW73L_19675 [Methylolobus aquaticus]